MRFYKRNGIWYFDVNIGGTRYRESTGVGDKGTAKLIAATKIRDLNGPALVSRPSLEQFTEEYLAWSKTRKRHSTILVEKSVLKRLKEDLPQVKHVDLLDARTADLFLAKLTDNGMKPGGINYYIRTLRAIFNVAKRWKYVVENPFASIAQIAYEREEPRVLDKAEISKLFAHAQHHDPDFIEPMRFFLFTGMRRAEVVGLEWDDINLEKGTIHIRKAKGKKPRYVPIFPQVAEILARQRGLKRPFPIVARDLSDRYSALAKEAGVKNTTLHDLRATYGSYLLAAGVAREVVQKILGHSAFTTTDEYYFAVPKHVVEQITKADFGQN